MPSLRDQARRVRSQARRRPRVTCLFRGRLGNQMYEVATTLAHAWDHDLRPLFGTRHRQLVADPRTAGRNRVTAVFPRLPTRPFVLLRSNAYMVVQNLDHGAARVPEALRHEPGRDRQLDGLFADEGYFKHQRAGILEAFSPTERQERRLRHEHRELLSGETVSVQIRRGDYVEQGMLRRYDLELDWYREALDRVGDVDRIVVFSDDPAWCRDNVDFGPKTHVVDTTGHADVEDLHLASWCTHHVICNSSYSWWAAWLGYDENRTVVQPANWFTDEAAERRGGQQLASSPEGWIRL